MFWDLFNLVFNLFGFVEVLLLIQRLGGANVQWKVKKYTMMIQMEMGDFCFTFSLLIPLYIYILTSSFLLKEDMSSNPNESFYLDFD